MNPEVQLQEKLAGLLVRLIERERTTIPQLACVANIDPKTVRRYLAAEYRIPDEVLRAWAACVHMSPEVRKVCTETLCDRSERLTAGLSDAPAGTDDERVLDVNRNGRIDVDDALEFADQQDLLSTQLRQVLRRATRCGHLGAGEMAELGAIHAEASIAMNRELAVIERLGRP